MWLFGQISLTVILGFSEFYRWFRAEVTARKDFSLVFVAFYRWFCACGLTVGANLNVLVCDRLRTPGTVEADILSSLIVFYNWFCKRTTAEADFFHPVVCTEQNNCVFIGYWLSNDLDLWSAIFFSTITSVFEHRSTINKLLYKHFDFLYRPEK